MAIGFATLDTGVWGHSHTGSFRVRMFFRSGWLLFAVGNAPCLKPYVEKSAQEMARLRVSAGSMGMDASLVCRTCRSS